jgi:A/G-specific adenine glycosylase
VPKKHKPHYQVAAGIISKGDQLLIAQRPAKGMLGGLWEFPGGKQEEGETLEECIVREIREELGIEIEVVERLTSVEHAFSHFSITLHAMAARYVSGEPQTLGCADWKWIAPEELDQFALPRADRLIVDFLRQHGRQMELFAEGVDNGK